MSLKWADRILSEKHREIGLYLEEDDHLLFLQKRGSLLPIAVFTDHATIEAIQEAADQFLSEITNGISFER